MSADTPSTEIVPSAATPLVTRQTVPQLPYAEYRPYLRRDFWFCCAYCTTSEAEASAVRFTIDHYEPRNARPDLKDTYSNLMYACDACNSRKQDRTPPANARAAGVRFYRPDEDVFESHFRLSGRRIEALTAAAEFTIEALDLNRHSLRRVRELREKLGLLGSQVAEGLVSLRKVKLDRLPPNVRGRVIAAIKNAEAVEVRLAAAIDAILEEDLRSPLIDDDPDHDERKKERDKVLKKLEVLYPGSWRGRR